MDLDGIAKEVTRTRVAVMFVASGSPVLRTWDTLRCPPPLRLAKFPTAFEVRSISLNGSTPAGPTPLPFVVFLAS